jgi:anti-sigma regulatory factor (Ser/Thr protein kinase)
MTTVTTELPRLPTSASTLGVQPREDAALLVSELVSNALQHGIGMIMLRIDVETDALRFAVSDQGNVALAPSPTPGAHGGWGLRIVAELADEWGVLAGSTKVWFRLVR